MTTYDCTNDVLEHKAKVKYWLDRFVHAFEQRGIHHDESKLQLPEKPMFDYWTPKLQETEFGSEEYKDALVGMGQGLKHHYEQNRHHPEHFADGINDMTLSDIVEMVCDWMAAAEKKNQFVNLDYLAERFGIGEQLVRIIANQLREEDLWNHIDNVPVPDFCPPNRASGPVDGFERRDLSDS